MPPRKPLTSISLGLLIVFTCALFAPARQAAAPAGGGADAQKVRKLLELSGSGDIGKQMMDQMFTSFRRAMPNVPVEFWEEASREVTANDEGTLHWIPKNTVTQYDLVEDLPVMLPRVLEMRESDVPLFVHVSYDEDDCIQMRFADQ